MIDVNPRRAAIQELVELLIEHGTALGLCRGWDWETVCAYGEGFPALALNGHMSTDTAAEIHRAAGLLEVWDTALPQSWWDAFYAATGEAPTGIVWGYDTGAGVFGRPYALTATAQRLLSQFTMYARTTGRYS